MNTTYICKLYPLWHVQIVSMLSMWKKAYLKYKSIFRMVSNKAAALLVNFVQMINITYTASIYHQALEVLVA